MLTITHINARQIIDSRGNPTIEADIQLSDGSFGRAAVPSGASTGAREAVEKRDGEKAYFGKGVLQAVNSVTQEIRPCLTNQKAEQSHCDQLMLEIDGTENKSNLGANAILGVSMALSRAIAQSEKIPLYRYFSRSFTSSPLSLPVPMVNILNGGAHANNTVDFQEFMIIPAGFDTFSDCLRCSMEVFHSLKNNLDSKGHHTAVGDEGGFTPNLKTNRQAIEVLIKAVETAGYKIGEQVWIGLDVASSEFYKHGKYQLDGENRSYESEEFADLLAQFCQDFPILSIEDGLDENDWQGWSYLTQQVGKNIQLVGDDLFVTNHKILQQGIEQNIANSILVKVNQIGTITETIKTMNVAMQADYSCVVSHRSGETEDHFIADLAVGSGSGQIKTGSMSRSDRIAKYNQLLRIEEQLGDKAVFAGKKAFRHL
jgi:enolase